MARARTGDVAAFGELYDRHAPQVLRVARLLLGSNSDADDLLHDVFLEAWQSVRAYDPSRASVLTWLLVRTRSRAHDRRARRRRELLARRTLLAEGVAPPSPPMAAEHMLATRAALQELPSPLRATAELMYVAGLTAPEIAEHTGVAEGTIRSRAARALERLARALR